MRKGYDYPGVAIVFYCHDGNGNFVMSKRSLQARDENGRWDIGGGGLEFGDTVEQTLRNEIKQEYCAEVLKFEFLGYRDVHREHEGQATHWIALDFKVLIDPVQVKNGEPNKFEEVKFFRLESLPENIHSQLPNFLQIYKDLL